MQLGSALPKQSIRNRLVPILASSFPPLRQNRAGKQDPAKRGDISPMFCIEHLQEPYI